MGCLQLGCLFTSKGPLLKKKKGFKKKKRKRSSFYPFIIQLKVIKKRTVEKSGHGSLRYVKILTY